jgi:hypothetical protein
MSKKTTLSRRSLNRVSLQKKIPIIKITRLKKNTNKLTKIILMILLRRMIKQMIAPRGKKRLMMRSARSRNLLKK